MDVPTALKTFRGLILDADGVLFTGEETRFVLPDGQIIVGKTRHHDDGQGISFLRALGIRVIFATGEGRPLESVVEKLNNLPSVREGGWSPVEMFTGVLDGKVASLEKWMKQCGLSWSDCAYIGDDRSDLEAIQKAGLRVVPANAKRVVKKVADIVLTKNGGSGAIREFAEMVLDARGVDESTLPIA